MQNIIVIVNLPFVTELFCIGYRGYLAFRFVCLVIDLKNSFATFSANKCEFLFACMCFFASNFASFEVMVGRASWVFYLSNTVLGQIEDGFFSFTRKVAVIVINRSSCFAVYFKISF